MFDVRDEGLSEFQTNLEYLINNMPKESRQILMRAGSKARTVYARVARQNVKKVTGNYHKGFKRGKVWRESDGSFRVRIYNNAPHAHLIEHGHRIVGKDGSEHGFQPGKKVMDKAEQTVSKDWDTILETELDKIMDKM